MRWRCCTQPTSVCVYRSLWCTDWRKHSSCWEKCLLMSRATHLHVIDSSQFCAAEQKLEWTPRWESQRPQGLDWSAAPVFFRTNKQKKKRELLCVHILTICHVSAGVGSITVYVPRQMQASPPKSHMHCQEWPIQRQTQPAITVGEVLLSF